jgi:alpha-amylase
MSNLILRMKRITALLLALTLALALASCTPQDNGARVSDNYRNFYEIFVRSFYDSNGDHLGDLAGVTAKLDYINQQVGADAIWLMPIMPSPTYHKYDVTNYLDIDPQYGTLADFDQLIAAAHKRDVHVIIDLVLNHTSNLHPWFDEAVQALWAGKESKYIGYYNFTLDNPGDGYNKITDRYYYECRFVSGMPDLNLDNPDVRSEIAAIVQFWLDRGVDGFRLDACTSFYTGNTSKNVEFLTWLNNDVKTRKADAYLIGEVWSDAGTIADYYPSGIDSFFNFPYAQATGRLVLTLNNQTGSDFANRLQAWNEQIRQDNSGAVDALFLSNHDNARSAGFLLRNLQKEKMAAALYLLAPGNPFIYYGEELGMNGSGADENKRLPMLWSTTDLAGIPFAPPNATQSVTDVAGVDVQSTDENSLLSWYHEILAIKAKNPEIARGAMSAIDTGISGIAAFSVTWNEHTVYIMHNLTSETQLVDLALLGDKAPKITSHLIAANGSKPKITQGKLTLPAFSSTILR